MSKSSKIIIILLVIILIAVLGVGCYFIYKTTTKIEEQNNEISKLKENELNTLNEENSSVISTDSTKTADATVTENTIKELFLNKIKADDDTNTEKLLDYRVDKVTIVKDDEKQSIVDMDGGQYYKADDTLAYVEYSVKPKDVSSTVWIAGNGEVEGEWIVGKVVCVCIRNREIITSGTGW